MTRLLTSESVTEGHPDKVCDIISDSILDAYLTVSPLSAVAAETTAKDGLVVVEGEVSAPTVLDHVEIARQALRDIGYTDADSGISPDGAGIINNIRPRDFDGNVGNYDRLVGKSGDELLDVPAQDQGIVVGYAVDDNPSLLPLPIYIASRIAERLAQVRKDGTLPLLRPDGKVIVSIEYDDDLHPVAFRNVSLSTQHSPDFVLDDVRSAVREQVIDPVLARIDVPLAANAIVKVNNGPFINGGPKADSGLTGRKIIVDTYGGLAAHGGGAFSGKDPSKVDRSAAYAARWVAKNIVAAGLAYRAQVTIGYFVAESDPISIDVETYGTETVDRARIVDAVKRVFDLRPFAIIRELDLQRPIYRPTAAYGHFGRTEPDFTWERTDRVDALKAAI
ncbi:methionine adenosyltransferase [Bifidobacterium vespertilionis]|uniref:Methionine adenosyltransferase n=1 Tax=Bifidobacterium vespertilionis TaxID=2562524 RepID=A0A5J5DU81_9BIFI|nr:methionine adenosyltransferase [Bifidobacterium vespertilionis]KAA8819584.1 methionine adenosyltransferase [Bifidobacterium vespertilionis]KAA8823408.1 methionine adenosyltransferase [Bifidobacterium vespertilionis]